MNIIAVPSSIYKQATGNPELITNGNFDLNIDGWSGLSSSIITWDVSGKMAIDNNGVKSGSGYSTNPVFSGSTNTYNISGDVLISSGGDGTINIYSCSISGSSAERIAGGTISPIKQGEETHFNYTNVQVNTDLSLFVTVNNSAAIWTLDNLSVKEV